MTEYQQTESPTKLIFFGWLSFVWVFILEFKFRAQLATKEPTQPKIDPSLTPFSENLSGLLHGVLIFFLLSFVLGVCLLLTASLWWNRWPDAEHPPSGLSLFAVFTGYFVWDLAMLVLAVTFPKILRAPPVVVLWITQVTGYLIAVSLFRGEAMRLKFRPTWWSTGIGLLGYWVCFPLVMGGAFLLSRVLGMPPVSTNPMMEALSGTDIGTFVALAVLAVAVGPLFEEFLFRGILYRQLRVSFGPWGGAFISAFIFAVVHVDLMATLPLFLLGVVFARLYEKTGTIWTSFFCHLLWNLGTVLVLSALG